VFKSLLLSILVTLSIPVWARPAAEDLATFLSIRFNQAVLKQDLPQLFEIDSLNRDQAHAARQFLQQNPVPAKELSLMWSSSHGPTVVLKYQKQVYRIDLSTLDQHKVTINGRTVKASSKIEEIARSLELAFPENRKRVWSPLGISPAWAGIGDFFKSATSAVVFAGYGTEDLGPDALLGVILHPYDPGEWIVESFDCQKDGKIAWKNLALSSEYRNGRLKKLAFSYNEHADPKYKSVLAVQGYGCETSPFFKDGDEWSPVTAFGNEKLEQNCKMQAQKYGFIRKCCAKAGCENAVKDKIESIKRSSAKDYNQIDPALRSAPAAK